MTRRAHHPDTTRQSILAAGRALFSELTYPEVTGQRICEQAGVPRGSLHHHFGSKFGLFMAVFEGLQHGVTLRIAEVVNQYQDPWERVLAGAAAFLDGCSEPAYQHVVLTEGPEAIGWNRWRELDADYYGHMVSAFVQMLAPAGIDDHKARVLAATLRGTLTELSLEIARSHDHVSTRREALSIIDSILRTWRTVPVDAHRSRPVQIGVGQLRASPSTYLDRAAAGEPIDVIRRGHVIARILSPHSAS